MPETGTRFALGMPDDSLGFVQHEARRIAEFTDSDEAVVTPGELVRRSVTLGYMVSSLLRSAPRCAQDDKAVRPVIDEAREIEWHCLTDLDSLTTAIDELDDLLGRLSTLEPDQLSQLEFTSIYNQLSVATLNGFALLAAGGGECRMETPYVPVQTVIGSDGQGHVCCYGHTIEHCVPPSE